VKSRRGRFDTGYVSKKSMLVKKRKKEKRKKKSPALIGINIELFGMDN
jgi:hypothetical protein